MNDSNTEFIASEEIEITDNADNAIVMTSEAKVDVVDEGITPTKEIETNKKRKKSDEIPIPITWKHRVSPHFRENCFLEGRASYQFYKSASAFVIYEQVNNLDVLVELLVQQSNIYL